jgi:hypothetical protein
MQGYPAKVAVLQIGEALAFRPPRLAFGAAMHK